MFAPRHKKVEKKPRAYKSFKDKEKNIRFHGLVKIRLKKEKTLNCKYQQTAFILNKQTYVLFNSIK